jgi:hypothetical protein
MVFVSIHFSSLRFLPNRKQSDTHTPNAVEETNDKPQTFAVSKELVLREQESVSLRTHFQVVVGNSCASISLQI